MGRLLQRCTARVIPPTAVGGRWAYLRIADGCVQDTWNAVLLQVAPPAGAFLMEALPLFIIGAFLMFLMDTFYVLDLIKRVLSPLIVSFLDLPIETVDAFLLCLARHEAGAVILMDLVKAQQLDYIQTIVSILACFVPCFANIMAMIKELGGKRTLFIVPLIVLLFMLTAGIINYFLRLAH